MCYHNLAMSAQTTLDIAEFHGDGISSELSRSVRAIAESLPIKTQFHDVDLSLKRRRFDPGGAFKDAENAMTSFKVAMKYPTITEDISPNKILREQFNFSVIHRPVKTIPGVATRMQGELDLNVVRIATGGTYEDSGRYIGQDSAISIRLIERKTSFQAAMFAFKLAKRLKVNVVSASKYTIQKFTDGLFERVVTEVSKEFPDIVHQSELFDALLAKLIMCPEDYKIIVTPNEYGDFLSDAACGMIGSIGLGASASYAFDEAGEITLAMFDPAGGTAPDIAGKGLCNPSAALWAFSMLLKHKGQDKVGRNLDLAIRSTISEGLTTKDLGGSLSTEAFTKEIIKKLT